MISKNEKVLLSHLENVKDVTKIMTCGCGGGNIILFSIRFQRTNLISYSSLQFISKLNNIFHVKDMKGVLLMSNQLTTRE